MPYVVDSHVLFDLEGNFDISVLSCNDFICICFDLFCIRFDFICIRIDFTCICLARRVHLFSSMFYAHAFALI